MTWGIFVIVALGLFLTYVIWQETRSHLHWRALVAAGNVWAIRELVSAEIERWHRMRPPAGVPLTLWTGVQTAELVAIGRDHIQLACGTEGEYRMAGGRREQVTSALDAAMLLAARLVEMVLYDIPEVKTDCVRVDVYSTVRPGDEANEQRCILTTTASREAAGSVGWEEMTARQIIEHFSSRFATDERGSARPIDPGPSLEDESGDETMPPEVRRARARRRARADDSIGE